MICCENLENAPISRYLTKYQYWPTVYGSCAFVVAFASVFYLPNFTAFLNDLGLQFGVYLGPLWRDGRLCSSNFALSFVSLVLYPLAGLIGVVSACAVSKIFRTSSSISFRFVTWIFVCALGLWGSQIIAVGPLDGTATARTVFGRTLSEMLPDKLTHRMLEVSNVFIPEI